MKHIISRGNKHVIDCPECECKFSFENEDIINASQFDTGDVICPQCDTTICLKYENGRYSPLHVRRGNI